MAADRDPPTAADYVVTALGPALVMLMVGSLVFFLVEVLYAGQYSGRLLYTMFFFVFGAVLVARISIQYDRARATAYGIALAVVVYLALLAYVEYPRGWLKAWGWLVNLGLLAVVWVCAHKLTWDCTHIDEKRTSSGRGLLSAAGLSADEMQESGDRKQEAGSKNQEAGDRKQERKRRGKKQKKPKHDSRLWAWIEKYKSHRDAQRTSGHTPGVWVLYFALAALPLFALGQSLIAPDDEVRRRNTFLQMTVYIASALGLLVTTSLLGVRRYLRQRKAKVPLTMTASWLGLGALLIVAFVALGAFLPRPHSEMPWFGIDRAGKSEREASKYAQRGDAAGKGDGNSGERSKAGDGSASAKGGKPGGGEGEKGKGGEGEKGKGSSGEKGDDSEAQTDERSRDAQRSESEGRDGNDSSQSNPPSGALAKVAGVVKWIVFALVAVLVLFALFFGVLKYLAPFTNWAQRWLDGLRAWWAKLFGKANGRRQPAGFADNAPLSPSRPPPFSAYSNPFADGTADEREPAELVAYTFEALDAWAWDRDHGRAAAETPLEFAARLGKRFPI